MHVIKFITEKDKNEEEIFVSLIMRGRKSDTMR